MQILACGLMCGGGYIEELGFAHKLYRNLVIPEYQLLHIINLEHSYLSLDVSQGHQG